MLDTNTLLTIAFSLISNFTNVVSIPPDAVPQSPADLERCPIGSPSSPIHLFLTGTKGTEFSILGGVVSRYTVLPTGKSGSVEKV